MPKLKSVLTTVSLISLLTGCAQHQSQAPTTASESLAGLMSMSSTNGAIGRSTSKQMTKIREMALREIALSLGAQSGLAWRSKQINEQLIKQTRQMDSIFDFNALVLEHNVLPPVLLEGRNTLNLANAQSIRVSDRTYKVAKQAHFVTTAPNWREYLWMDYQTPDLPEVSMLPKTQDEKQVWRESVQRGWTKGVEQANSILEESVARIKEDYVGMILYRKLLAMNMVSAPFVSHTDLGVTGDGEEIRIDDRVLRITALPALNTNAKEWRAAVAMDEKTLAELNALESVAQSAEIHITSQAWQPVITPNKAG